MEKTYSLKRATIINAGGKYTTIILQLLVNAILSRLLSPDDYGIVAVITVFSTFFTTLSDMGFSTAVIQRKDLKNDEIDRIFFFTLIISVFLALVFAAFSFAIAKFYGDAVYIRLGMLLSLSLFFNALNMVPNGIMNREKKFLSIAIRTVVAYLTASIIAVFLALNGWSYYAIVIQTILSSMIIFLWNFINTKPQFRFRGCIESVKKVINYSGFQFAFNIVNYFSRNLDNLLTGKFMGNVALGYYYMAYNLMLYPINNLAGVISPVLHPLLSDFQKEKEIIYQKYIKIIKVLFLVSAYTAPFCYLAANEIINILYGSQWAESVRCFELLSVAILPQFIGSSAGAIYQSLGKTKLLFCNGVLNTAITIVAIVGGVLVGKNIIALSACVACAYVIHFFTTHYMLLQLGFELSFVKFLKELVPEFCITLIMSIAVFLNPFLVENVLLSAMAKAAYLAVIYLIMLGVTKDYRIILQLIKRKLPV